MQARMWLTVIISLMVAMQRLATTKQLHFICIVRPIGRGGSREFIEGVCSNPPFDL